MGFSFKHKSRWPGGWGAALPDTVNSTTALLKSEILARYFMTPGMHKHVVVGEHGLG